MTVVITSLAVVGGDAARSVGSMMARPLTLLAVSTLAVVACSSSGDDSSAPDESSVSDTAADTVADDSESTPTAAAGDTEVASSDSTVESDVEVDPDNEFCQKLIELDSGDVADPETPEAALDIFDDLVDVAPEEVADDMKVLRDAFGELAQLDENDPEADAEFFEVFTQPEVEEAGQALEEYGQDVCGLAPADTVADITIPTYVELTVPDATDG